MANRFLIAPFNSGLQDNLKPWYKDESFGILKNYTRRCIMRLRKDSIDIAGLTFHDLTALRPIENKKVRGVVWECFCVCGNKCLVPGGHLRSGERKSCGCRSERRIKETGINRLYSMYKQKAKLRGLEFSLDKKVFGNLILADCYYCGSSPQNKLKRLKTNKLQIEYNGIDRFDHTRGYSEDNCVPCCYYCNHAKLDLTFDKFKNHIERIYKWLHKDS